VDNFFSTHGDELFGILFKLTFYNDDKYFLCNSEDLSLAPMPHADLAALV